MSGNSGVPSKFFRFGASLLLVAILLFPACGRPTSARPTGGPVNVLMVVMDTTRADHLSLDGYDRPTTPAISTFAKDAVTFLDAWSPAGWTGPAHASLFTGLRPVHHGYLLGNQDFLGKEATTLAEILSSHGYRTACFSNNEEVSPAYGLTQGFQTYASVLEQPEYMRVSSEWAHERALDTARAAKTDGRPFFVFVNDMEDHLPYDPPQSFSAKFLPPGADPARVTLDRAFNFPDTVEILFGGRRLDPVDWQILTGLYDADVAHLDQEIGRLLHGFRKAGLLDHTLVVLTADHGEHLGEHGLCDHKESLYQPIGHVPLVLRYPGIFDGGRRVRDLVRLEDVFPTVLSVCGIPVPGDLDGKTLTRDLPGRISRAEHGDPSPKMLATVREFLTVEQIRRMRYSLRAVNDGRYHLLRWSTGREELYDLRNDPGERKDLESLRPGVVTRLRALLDP